MYKDFQFSKVHEQDEISEDYLDYIRDIDQKLPGAVNNIAYGYGVDINLLVKRNDDVFKFNTASHSGIMAMLSGNSYWQELLANSEFTLSMYELIGEGSRLPASKNEIVLVVDEYNRIDKEFF